MSTITPHYRSVQQLLQNQSFSIDEYQREYKWEKKNIDELLSDLLEKFQTCYRKGDTTEKVGQYEDYFLGSIIVSKRSGKNYLIDGQQRVTSLTLLLIHLHREATAHVPGVVSTLAPLIYSDHFGKPNFNLDIPERLPVIEALFRGDPFNPASHDESVRTMHARYGDIEAIELADELGDAFPHFIYWLIKKVGLIEIATDNDNYAYAIFETMNDRGKPLSPVDMLKAYLLAPIQDVAQRRNANHVWKKQVLDLISWGEEPESERDATQIKAWFRAQYAESVRDRKAGSSDKDWELIGNTFHRWARDNNKRLKLGTEAENLTLITSHFPFYAKAYLRVQEASWKYTSGLEAVYYNAHNEFTWQNTVLLAPLRADDDPDTLRRKIGATATYLDIWLMRRVVNYVRVGYSTVSYAMYLLCKDIRRKSLPELVTILTDKLAADDVTFEGYEGRGRKGVTALGLNQFSRWYIYHLLARITAYTDAGAGRPDMFDKYVDRDQKNPWDIEHIWADDRTPYKNQFADESEFQDWRNHVACLVLLPADVNRSYQDKPYAEKVPHYAKQNAYAASLAANMYKHQPKFATFCKDKALPFKPYEKFGKKEHQERRALILALANLVWSPDRLKEFLA